MISTDDTYQHYPVIKQSKVRKLSTYASSISSSGSASSVNNSPNNSKQKLFYPNGDNDDGYASFTTTSTFLGSNNSSTLHRDDSLYYTSGSERFLSKKTPSVSRALAESESDKSQVSDDDELEGLLDWSSLNQQVQTLVSRFDKWLHEPLPDRSIPIKKPRVEHAYPVLQRRTSSIPLAINLATDNANQMPNQSNYVVNFVQSNYIPNQKTAKTIRPRVHFNFPTEKVRNMSVFVKNNSNFLFLLASALYNLFETYSIDFCNQYTTTFHHMSLL